MNFKRATDLLGLPAADIAKAFGLKPATIRQMRQAPTAAAHRSPPADWQKVIVGLARKRSRELQGLIEELERGGR